MMFYDAVVAVVVTFVTHQVVATVAGPKSVINMELYKSNLTEEIQKFVAHFVQRRRKNIAEKNSTKTKYDSHSRFKMNETTLLPERSLVLGLVTSMVKNTNIDKTKLEKRI